MKTCEQRSHILDSRFYGQAYTTPEAARIFCDFRRMQRWLEVETALASCQAKLGIIPKEAAAQLSASANLADLDISAIQEEIKATGHSLIPLLKAWQQKTQGEAGQYIHYGATTQDIQDTAQSLELKEVCGIIEQDLEQIIALLADLAEEHRDLVMIGRTHGQPALPTTLGLKIAGWLDEAMRNRTRLANCRESLLASQLFGGVGTMSALSEQADELLEMFTARLGLHKPMTGWHSCRDRLADYLAVLALLAGGLASMANEICQLAKIEISELAEPFETGQVGSSTMPHKRNPELCEQVVVLARLIKANAVSGLDGLINEHERDYRAVRLEWVAVTEGSMFICAALAMTKKILSGLQVNTERITKNLERAAELISTEDLMFRLGEKVGKQSAHELVYQASMEAHDQGCCLLDILAVHPQVASHFSSEDLAKSIDPASQTGQAGPMVDRLVARARKTGKKIEERSQPPCPLSQFCATCGS